MFLKLVSPTLVWWFLQNLKWNSKKWKHILHLTAIVNTLITKNFDLTFNVVPQIEAVVRICSSQNFSNFTGKHLCWSLFLIHFSEKRLQHRCFAVKYVKILRASFLKNTSGGCSCPEDNLKCFKETIFFFFLHFKKHAPIKRNMSALMRFPSWQKNYTKLSWRDLGYGINSIRDRKNFNVQRTCCKKLLRSTKKSFFNNLQ